MARPRQRSCPPVVPCQHGDVAVYRVRSAEWRRWAVAVPRHERAVARLKRQPRDRMAYLACRGFLRMLLGARLGLAPGAVPIVVDGNGRPVVAGVSFSIAHADSFSLIAVAVDRRVGVDVESLYQARDVDAIAEGFFTPAEAARILRTAPTARQRALLHAWTRSEAIAKATGLGLTLPAERSPPGSRGITVRTLERRGRWIATVAADGGDWRPVMAG